MREIPDGEREEVRQIFASKGFGGETLDRIVDGITSDGRLWLDTVLSEEFGLRSTDRTPSRAAMTTFAAFVLVGALPLIPFLVPFFPPEHRFVLSAVVTSLAFLGVGAVKGAILRKKILRPALSTLVTGGGAAVLAFLVALLLRAVYGLG
jgi:VIT1/CCC1 family predicted Fe2+/Mn2+ transporter